MPEEKEEIFIVEGGKPLKGEIQLAGAKNAATKILMASLLTQEECILENFPIIGDTDIALEICRAIGSKIYIEKNTLHIKTPKILNNKVINLSRRNRIPILTLGILLSRVGEGEVQKLGGDKIGPRPVDMHLEALKALGAYIEETENSYKAKTNKKLHGAEITLRYPSVGATEQVIMASVLAEGKTVLKNAAMEPEIIDLIKVLQKMGAIIELGVDRVITIYGVDKLNGFKHHIIYDRNEAVSFACLATATNGKVLVKGANQEHLITFLNSLRRIGGEYEVKKDGILFWRKRTLSGIKIETDTHPGFMTDWQQPFIVLLTQAHGVSIIHETVYEDRFGYTKELNKMGADIKVVTECLGTLNCRFKDKGFLHSAIVDGPKYLKGSEINIPDLRAGIATIIAALVAEGESIITGVKEVDRGYEKIDTRLMSLGANIKRVRR